jgi:hypothetical protein
MENKFDFHNCGNDDALSFGKAMLKIEKLKETVNRVLPENGLGQKLNLLLIQQALNIDVALTTDQTRHLYENWFGEGIDCEILRVGAQGWMKGKIKLKLNVTIEFCPDEPKVEETPENNQLEISPPESPLDDLRRQLLNHENQPNNS